MSVKGRPRNNSSKLSGHLSGHSGGSPDQADVGMGVRMDSLKSLVLSEKGYQPDNDNSRLDRRSELRTGRKIVHQRRSNHAVD